MDLKSALFLITCAVTGGGACGDNCSLVRQDVEILDPDPNLQEQINTCLAGSGGVSHPDGGFVTNGLPSFQSTACATVCAHVLQIIDQFPGTQKATDCSVYLEPADGGERPHVVVTYRPPC